mmetsp:Transcript_19806/g.45185  ORF Transcript_19806/g.45185 Transcript_19806/m.45185 type:complete len:110 (-) Transcript_19806:360-689(-)
MMRGLSGSVRQKQNRTTRGDPRNVAFQPAFDFVAQFFVVACGIVLQTMSNTKRNSMHCHRQKMILCDVVVSLWQPLEKETQQFVALGPRGLPKGEWCVWYETIPLGRRT